MADRSLIFPAVEYRARIARLQAALNAAELDAILLTAPADIFWATGFLTRFWESPARPWFVLVPGFGDPVAVIPAIGEDLMSRTWVPQIRTWPAPQPGDDGVSLLAGAIAEVTPPSARIGVPMGLETHLRMPLGDFETLVRSLAPRSFADATDAIHRAREVKSEAEIDAIRTACAIAGRAFERVPQIAHGGMSLAEVFRRFQILLLEEGADWVSYVAGGAGPGGYGDVISPADERPLQTGDAVMLDTGAVRNGYFCDFDRNWSVGPPDSALAGAHDALFGATEDALSSLRPGMEARDAHRILSQGLMQRGAQPLGGRLGHGLGVTLTEWPSFTPLDRTPLRAGMVLTLEPGVEIAPGRILLHEENIVLREDGPELLSPRAPAELPRIPA